MEFGSFFNFLESVCSYFIWWIFLRWAMQIILFFNLFNFNEIYFSSILGCWPQFWCKYRCNNSGMFACNWNSHISFSYRKIRAKAFDIDFINFHDIKFKCNGYLLPLSRIKPNLCRRFSITSRFIIGSFYLLFFNWNWTNCFCVARWTFFISRKSVCCLNWPNFQFPGVLFTCFIFCGLGKSNL